MTNDHVVAMLEQPVTEWLMAALIINIGGALAPRFPFGPVGMLDAPQEAQNMNFVVRNLDRVATGRHHTIKERNRDPGGESLARWG